MDNPPRSVVDHASVFLALIPMSASESRGIRLVGCQTHQTIWRSELTKIERPGERQGNPETGCASGEDAVGLGWVLGILSGSVCAGVYHVNTQSYTDQQVFGITDQERGVGTLPIDDTPSAKPMPIEYLGPEKRVGRKQTNRAGGRKEFTICGQALGTLLNAIQP